MKVSFCFLFVCKFVRFLLRAAKGLAPVAVLTGLLAVTSHLTAHCSIEVSANYRLFPTMFFCISGIVGSNKTGAVSLIQDTIRGADELFRVIEPLAKSCLNHLGEKFE